jgi:ATP-binding cassette, subfamily B, bacterial
MTPSIQINPRRLKKTWSFLSDVTRAVTLVWNAHPKFTSLIAILTVIQGVLPVISLWISKLLIDTVAITIQGGALGGQHNLMHLLVLVGAQAGLFFFVSFLGSVQESIRPMLGDILSNQINLKILNKANSLEVSFFENEEFYNKLQNAYQESGHRPLETVFQIFSLAQTLTSLTSMIVLIFTLHWVILPLILVSSIPSFIIQNRYGMLNYWMLRERSPELRKQSYYGSLLTSSWFIKEIRIFHLENYFLSLYQSLFHKFFGENQKLTLKRTAGNILASIVSILGSFLASIYIVLRVVARTITIGDFAMFSQAVASAQGQIQASLGGMSQLYSNALFLRNLFEFLSMPCRDLSAGQTWSEPLEEIEFKEVSFGYPGKDCLALEKVSFKIRRGQSLALVGKNGAGKTTLVKLLCRLYEPTSGEILINGKRIVEYSPHSLQEQISVLFQDFGTYYITARENIGVGQIDNLADIAAIKKAAKRSGADIPINKLSQKYENMLGKWFDEGTELSGGEWQKIALARGFFRKGKMLILDEPTASLDAEAEFEVFNNLTENKDDRITLLISHRFSTVRIADNILVLDAGKCIENGSHEQLMSANGQYAYLFRLQAQGYNLN